VTTERQNKVFSIVILFLLGTTLFNTLRANRVEHDTTSFRKEAQYKLALTRVALEEQKATNARLEQQIAALVATETDEQSTE
jgi:hypothetical protein